MRNPALFIKRSDPSGEEPLAPPLCTLTADGRQLNKEQRTALLLANRPQWNK